MRIMVTGAGGFVGGHLLQRLMAAGHQVIACSHRPFQSEAFAVEVFDIQSGSDVQRIVDRHQPDAVIHLAAQASVKRSWEDPAETYRVNIVGTGNLLESLKDRPSTRVLLVGSAQEYGDLGIDRPLVESDQLKPTSPYAVSKVAQEVLGGFYHRALGLQVLIARAFNHTGPGQSPEYAVGSFSSQIVDIESARREPRIEVGFLDSTRDFLDVRDVADAYRLLIEGGVAGEAYNVASGEGVRIGDVLKLLLERAGLAAAVEILEEPVPRTGDPKTLVGDSSKLQTATGWKPEIAVEQSLWDTLDWYRKRRR